jgi:hypothetical protein
MSVRTEGFEALAARFEQLRREVATKKEQQQILSAGAAPIVSKSKTYIKKSREEHFYYQSGKKIPIKPGNLKLSMRQYKQRDGNVSIGPRRLKKVAGSIGDSAKTASGFYAAALYKNASRFRRDVTERAASAQQTKSLERMDKQVARILKKYQ